MLGTVVLGSLKVIECRSGSHHPFGQFLDAKPLERCGVELLR